MASFTSLSKYRSSQPKILTFVVVVSDRHDALFVVGSLDETLMMRGMRYHPTDIENTVLRCHKNVCEW